MAKACGAPIGPVVLATNANPTLAAWAATGAYAPRASIATIANAMDVGAPSNFERLDGAPLDPYSVRVEKVDDTQIRARIKADHGRLNYVWCPHSACAAEAFARLPEREQHDHPWLVAATAHPFKFADVVEPVIGGAAIAPPPALAAVLERPARAASCAPDLDALSEYLDHLESLPA
jgi:threonine synthase